MRLPVTIPLIATAFIFSLVSSVGAENEPLPRFPELSAKVEFWRDVFTKHTSREIVFHDPEIVELVWAVRDVSRIIDSRGSEARAARDLRGYIEREIRDLAATLRRLESTPAGNEDEKRIVEALKRQRAPLPSHGVLASRIRVQKGLGDKLCESYRRAVRYLPRMRTLLKARGVPEQVVFLPLVESGYEIGAHSHKGAAGIWQFTRATGRRYLHIDHLMDERRDPILATEAAAKYLRANYDRLGNWPLAITAYNHGEHGIEYAVRKHGTRHLPKLIAEYRGKYFGFASKNFYAELLAAIDAMTIAETRCSATDVAPLERDSVKLDAYVSFGELARAAGVDVGELAELNPAFTADVVRGRLRAPRGSTLFIPHGSGDAFVRAYATLPATARSPRQTAAGGIHVVKAGETLSEIAARYRVSTSALQALNGIADPRRLLVGQRLKVAGALASARNTPEAVAQGEPRSRFAVVLAPGDTLSHLARRYSVTVASLQRHNGIKDPRSVRVGQRIEIPAKGGQQFRTHRVGPGQTLSHIARIYRTSVSALQRHNGISDPSRLRSGQVIHVPM